MDANMNINSLPSSSKSPTHHTDSQNPNKRSTMGKAAKEACKKSKVTIESLLCDIVERFEGSERRSLKMMEERLEWLEKSKLKRMEESLLMEQIDKDTKIVNMDTSNLDPLARAYIEQLKNEIYAKEVDFSNLDPLARACYEPLWNEIQAKEVARRASPSISIHHAPQPQPPPP